MSEELQLQLGDIIEITAPDNEVLNKNVFLIDYIDEDKIKIIDVNLTTPLTLSIENGDLKDKTIESIALLSRSLEDGYARQNALVPGTWIDLFFSGDVPQVVTGEITNLEEDMIELKVYPSDDVIYIDFAYKGLPEGLNIKEIIVRDIPSAVKSKEPEPIEEEEEVQDEETDPGLLEAEVPVVERMKEIFIDADQIFVGEDLDQITQLVQVDESQERYGIDNQTNDLLDDMLSTIPTINRTPAILREIQILINRFVQLRSKFSTFDEYNNVVGAEKKTAMHKPIVKNLIELNKKIDWIIPVSKTKKNVYDIDDSLDSQYNDINSLTFANSRINDTEALNEYYLGQRDYEYLLAAVQNMAMPFTSDAMDPNVIKSLPVNTNLEGVTNNLDDFYSSVVKDDIIKRKRFFMQTYNTSLTILNQTDDKNKHIRQFVRENEIIDLCSFLILPLPFVQYSKINLNATTILQRSQLNKIKLFKSKFLNNDFQPNLFQVTNDEFHFDQGEFLTSINDFTPEEGLDYETFVNNIIPRTKRIFELLKPSISNNYNLLSIVNQLEPFLIYHDDLTYKQYQAMVTFVNKQITEYKKKIVNKNREFQQLLYRSKKSSDTIHHLFNLLKNDILPNSNTDLQELVMKQVYDIETKLGKKQELVPYDTASEIISNIYKTDNGNLLNTAIAVSNLSLFTPIDIQSELEKNNEELLQTIEAEKQNNTCSEFVLTKRYVEMDELLDDNNKTIYFDKNLDSTHYDILNTYRQEESTMSPEDFKQFLIEKLIQNIGLSMVHAEEDAEAMIIGKREVREGQYAILDQDDIDPVYFKRVDGEWEQDEDQNINAKTEKMFCDLQTNCLMTGEINVCKDNKLNEGILKQKNLSKLLKEFDLRYESSKEELTSLISNEVVYLSIVAKRLREIRENLRFKNNDEKVNLGLLLNEIEEPVISPYSNLLEIILKQSDFAKKQGDIIQFCYKFTRDPNKDENQYWRYCTETDTKLIPMFLFTLAGVFIEKGDYLFYLEQICANQGKLSDDGDKWVDEHSGYVIRNIDYSTEEGYSEAGYKLVSHEILEKDKMG